MNIPMSAGRPKHAQISPEAQADGLWKYVQAMAPRFTLEAARDVVTRVSPRPGEDPKLLAKRVRAAFQAHRVSIKHTNALHAASLLAGFTSWHRNLDDNTNRLTFTTFDVDLARESYFRSWEDLSTELRHWVDRLLPRGQLPLGVLVLSFGSDAVSLSTPVPSTEEDEAQGNQLWPLGTVTSSVEDDRWLEGAPFAFEKLRRHLEEQGLAVLDGYAVLRLCGASRDERDHPMAVTVTDVVNSELVLMREDNESDPNSGYEIARGDELRCWHQLELSLRSDLTNDLPHLEITIPVEGAGAWHVNGNRYVWAVETLKPEAYVPGRVNRQIGIADCERLLHRYYVAKRIHGKDFRHHEQSRHIDYLGGPPATYRVDLHFLLHQLNNAGLTWEGYIEKFNAEPLPMQRELPVGFVFQLLESLKIEQPNQVFAKPNLSEMERVDDDALLRALVPRVDHVRYVMPRDLDDVRSDELREAIREFAESLRMQKLIGAGALKMEDELPHLVWASDANELRLVAESLGLVMYAATVPHLHSTKGLLPELQGINAWPWAFGNALFLRFVGGAQ
jgi:hypothetical protein